MGAYIQKLSSDTINSKNSYSGSNTPTFSMPSSEIPKKEPAINIGNLGTSTRGGLGYTMSEIARLVGAQNAEKERIANAPRIAQQKYAKEFESNLPMMQNKLMGDLGSQTSEQMGAALKSNRENASSRGLLHSGLRQAGDQNVRAGAASQMSQGRMAIGEALRTQSKSLNDQAVQSGLDIQRSSQQMADMAYQEALRSMSRRSSAMSGIMGAAGTAAGIYLGAAGGPSGMAAGAALGGGLGSALGGSL